MMVKSAHAGRPFWTHRRITDLSCGSILAVLAFLGLVPYLIAFVVSFKDDSEYARSAWLPTLPLHPENWANAWNQINIYWVNSLLVAGAVTFALLVLSTVAGFVFARYSFPGRGPLFFLIIIMIAVPSVINLVPLFLLIKSLHMIDTLWALIVPYTVGGLYPSVYLLRNSIRAINDDLFDAARMDGSSGPQMYWFIVLPLSLPIMGTVIMTQLTGVWNEYIWAFLVINDSSKRTIGTGLQFFTSEQTTSFGPLFAGYLLASVPLLVAFTFLSRYFVAGIQAGTSK